MALAPSPSASSPKNPDTLPAFRAAKSTAISRANRYRIPFIRQSGAGLADGTARRCNELWTPKVPGRCGSLSRLSVRRACARRPSCRAPDDSARRHRRSAPAVPGPAATAVRPTRASVIRGNHPVTLRADQRHARVDQFLLRVEHVERGALADTRFLAHAVERDFRRLHLRLRRLDIALSPPRAGPTTAPRSAAPGRARCRDRAAAARAFPWPAGSANIPRRPGRSARVNWPSTERVEALEPEQAALVVLLHAALQRQRRIKRAFGDLHRLQRDVDIVLRGRRPPDGSPCRGRPTTAKCCGEKRSTGEPGASFPGSTPITCR